LAFMTGRRKPRQFRGTRQPEYGSVCPFSPVHPPPRPVIRKSSCGSPCCGAERRPMTRGERLYGRCKATDESRHIRVFANLRFTYAPSHCTASSQPGRCRRGRHGVRAAQNAEDSSVCPDNLRSLRFRCCEPAEGRRFRRPKCPRARGRGPIPAGRCTRRRERTAEAPRKPVTPAPVRPQGGAGR